MMKKRLRTERMTETESTVRMTLKHIVGFRNLVQLFLYVGTCLRSKFSPDPLSWYLQHMLTALPIVVLSVFVN